MKKPRELHEKETGQPYTFSDPTSVDIGWNVWKFCRHQEYTLHKCVECRRRSEHLYSLISKFVS